MWLILKDLIMGKKVSTPIPIGAVKPPPPPPPPIKYEKPLFEEHERKFFTEEIWDKFNGGKGCQQCSGCHGCR